MMERSPGSPLCSCCLKKRTWELGGEPAGPGQDGAEQAGGKPEEILPLARALQDTDPEVRENAAWGVGEMAGFGSGDEMAIMYLNPIFSEEGSESRSTWAWTIGRMPERLG